MYFKEQRYEKAVSLTYASTYTKQLPESGLLDSIDLFFRCKNANPVTSAYPTELFHHITKLEVIGNNDKTLMSLTAQEALAIAFRKMGALPPFKNITGNNLRPDLTIPLLFGRKFKDTEYALDLNQWDKVELKITNDATTALYASGELNVDIRLCTIEDATKIPSKFMKQWEYETGKPAADASYVRPKLPTSGKLRALMIQLDPDLDATTCHMTHDPLSDTGNNWKLWFKDRALTIIDARPRDIMRDEHRRLGIGHASAHPQPSTTRYCDFYWGEVLATAVQAYAGSAATPPTGAGERDRWQIVNDVGTCTDYGLLCLGVGLFHTFEIPFYLPNDVEAEYLDLATYKPIEIEWQAAYKDNTHRIILEKPVGQGAGEYA
jgi:hypothetical protein